MRGFTDLKFTKTDIPNGIQAVVNYGEYDLSIIKNSSSYGGKQGLYEIGVFKGSKMVEMPGITEEGDSVKGFLSESDVSGIIKKMHLATGSEPKQVDIKSD
jgi:hypothetical protein